MSLSDPAPLVKPWWQSKTIIGIAVMLLSQILKLAKVDIVPQELTDIVSLVLDTAGAALAIYGRMTARKALKLTVPGGRFNPHAEVRKAQPVRRDRGHANFRALLLIVALFAMLGGAMCIGPVTMREVPMQAGGKPLAEWVQVVPVVDKRPFWQRLWSSVRVTPSVAVAYFDGTVSAKLTKIELRGGAEF
jgi:hypothetical protein